MWDFPEGNMKTFVPVLCGKSVQNFVQQKCVTTLKLVKVSFGFTSQLKLKTLNFNVKPKIKAKT